MSWFERKGRKNIKRKKFDSEDDGNRCQAAKFDFFPHRE